MKFVILINFSENIDFKKAYLIVFDYSMKQFLIQTL